MPLYEFRCSSCDNLFEELKAHDDDLPVCPVCYGDVERIMSAPVFRFKGHGFHATDYNRHGPRQVGRTK